MPAEVHNGYFRSFWTEKAILPEITVDQMLAERCIIAPRPLRLFLQEAKQFLVTEDGPNLEHRQITAPSWFDYWDRLLRDRSYRNQPDLIRGSLSNIPVAFEDLSGDLHRASGWSGIINVAGGEGHQGHIHVARHMRNCNIVTIWAFEGDEHNRINKARGGTFLPPAVRLSMWANWGINYVTVLPRKDPGIDSGTHYDELFRQSGADIYFVTEDDPAFEAKSKRGRQEPWRIIPAYRPPSTSDRLRYSTYSTTSMLKGLMGEPDDDFDTIIPEVDDSSIFGVFDESIFEE